MKTPRIPKIAQVWLPVVLVLALLLLGHGFGAETLLPPREHPAQVWSRIHYDPKLTDPFFETEEWSYLDYDLEGTPLDKRSKERPRLKHTAKCFSTAFLKEPHLIKFCKAMLVDVKIMDLLFHEDNAAFVEYLRVRIRNGEFTCEYSRVSDVPLAKGLILTTKRQELILDKKLYRKGDVIKGRVYFECIEEVTDPEYVNKLGRDPRSIKVYGFFKTIVE